MIEKNFEYLARQIKFTGFGEEHEGELKEKMEQNLPEFQILHEAGFGTDLAVVSLQFRRSTESGMYFFNSYHMTLKNGHQPSPIQQTFYLNSRENSITLKEAYNLLNGRSVQKEFTAKAGNKYWAWVQVDFKETDKNGNYKLKQYHQNYGFNLLEALSKHPIRELLDELDKKRLLESLQRGNRQSVTISMKGNEQKVFIEAVPQYKSLNFFDPGMQRLKTDRLYGPDLGQAPQKIQEQTEFQMPPSGEEEANGNPFKETVSKRNKISIS
jgi:hypothetical protein